MSHRIYGPCILSGFVSYRDDIQLSPFWISESFDWMRRYKWYMSENRSKAGLRVIGQTGLCAVDELNQLAF